MLNADDIVHPDDQPRPRKIMMRGLNQLRKVRKPKNERPETRDQVRRGIPHDDQAALDKAAERRVTRAAKRALRTRLAAPQPAALPAEPQKVELVWDI